MQKEQNITIFHLQRKDGSSLFLHPFSDLETLLKLNDKVKIIGKYGNEPRVESLTMFRNDLYRLIETSVKSWISDIRFIPRFILSAGAFLVIYLFTSFVIRDPVPMIDELALSLGGSIALFYMLAKRDQNSEKASKKRLELRILIDKIVFEEDPFIKEIEDVLYSNESMDKAALIESLTVYDNVDFKNVEDKDIKQIVSYLDKIFSGKIYRKKIEKFNKNDAKRLVKWVGDNKIDLSLFAMYKKLKKKIYM